MSTMEIFGVALIAFLFGIIAGLFISAVIYTSTHKDREYNSIVFNPDEHYPSGMPGVIVEDIDMDERMN